MSLTTDELALLERAAADKAVHVRLVVTACAYSCCGRGWRRRDGYEQEYVGWIDNLHVRGDGTERWCSEHARVECPEPGSFMLYSPGIGTLSYVIACRTADVALIELPR